jgi:hypothetical protein
MSLEEIRKTQKNLHSEILEARVIANYGDPGLDEDYHFDILSRYVIVMIESSDRVLTVNKWASMLAVVKRPEILWIDAVNGKSQDATSQQRSDFENNINVGSSQGYSVNSIPRINNPYKLGDIIKIKKLNSLASINTSVFGMDESNVSYGSWHTQGISSSYFSSIGDSGLLLKTISLLDASSNSYNFTLTKYQYEAMSLYINSGDSSKTTKLMQIFSGSWAGPKYIYLANGGYLFKSLSSIPLYGCFYEDTNSDNKQRTSNDSCVPLVVTTPNSFPTPKTRSVGTISYSPSYSSVVRS